MAKINTLQALRDHQLRLIEDLAAGIADIKEVAVATKAAEGIFSSVNLELEYAKALGKEPYIPFLGKCTGKNSASLKKLPNKD